MPRATANAQKLHRERAERVSVAMTRPLGRSWRVTAKGRARPGDGPARHSETGPVMTLTLLTGELKANEALVIDATRTSEKAPTPATRRSR